MQISGNSVRAGGSMLAKAAEKLNLPSPYGTRLVGWGVAGALALPTATLAYRAADSDIKGTAPSDVTDRQ